MSDPPNAERRTPSAEPPNTEPPAVHPQPSGARLRHLTLLALGVVYGDIGTSPLYAIQQTFYGDHRVAISEANVLGILSLVFWSLVIVISIKYLTYIVRMDNRGEGGILSLMALVRGAMRRRAGLWLVITLGLFGACLLYADGILTPAISVLGAVEGLGVAAPKLAPYIVPISGAILLGLFLLQRRGTAGVGALFGPVVLVWFTTIAVLGIRGIMMHPGVLEAVLPWHAVRFFQVNGFAGFLVLGAVFLVVTGGEALYADLGHFGRRPIQLGWFAVAAPALLLNYLGQGALVLTDPETAHNPFYRLAPEWFLYPLLVIATCAAIIASQAIISGSFSLTRQAVQLGYLPRSRITHTSAHEIGQIYVPVVNWALMVGVLGVVFGFRSAGGLANAYGVALTTTMVITTLLATFVSRRLWGWSRWLATAVTAAFLVPDLAFFGSNFIKITAGGWFPLLVALVFYIVMTTWKRGRGIVVTTMREAAVPLDAFIRDFPSRLPRVPGTAVIMTSDATIAPPVLMHHLKHNKVVHQRVILLSVVTKEVPHVTDSERVKLTALGHGFYVLVAAYGFMESPHVPQLLASLESQGLEIKLMETTFYLGRETLIPTHATRPKRAALRAKGLWMAMWRKKLFVVMTNNARSATAFFHLPANRVVELGAQVQI
ncbi:MAG: potassium transporter Kup [Gemmatimonadales bacterium]